MMTREPSLDPMTVVLNVEIMALAKLFAGLLDCSHPAGIPHLLRGEVGMSSRSIELSNWLRIKLNCDAMLLTDPIEKPASED